MPTTPHAEAPPLLYELLLFCAIAGVVIPLVRRLHFSRVLAFLVIGALLGPYGLGGQVTATSPWRFLTIPDLDGARAIAEFGIVFLLFSLGLELSPARLWALRRWVFGLGNLQVFATAIPLGFLAWSFGNTPTTALVLGLALALSSTAIVMQLLAERHAIATPVGRAAFAVLLMQDLTVVPLLVLVDHLGVATDSSPLGALLVALGKAAIAVGAIMLLGKRVLQPLFHRVSATHQPDAFMALILFVTLGTAALTWAGGLSFALGSFLAGLLLAETAYRHQIELTVEPFKGLLIGVFFLSVGMGIDLRALVAEPIWLPLSVLGLFAIKTVIAALGMRAFGLRWSEAIEGAFLLGQGGEFAFIVIGIAMNQALLTAATGHFMLLVVGFSMLCAPLAAKAGRSLARRWAPVTTAADTTVDLPRLRGHVVIAGFGRVGRLLGEVLDSEGIPFVALDNDAARVAQLHAAGAPVYVGDAEHPDLLPGTLVEGALAVVITLDDPAAAARLASHLQRRVPAVTVLARARDEQHAAGLLASGVQRVVPETLEAALQLGGHMLEALGYSTELAHLRLQSLREARLADLLPRSPSATSDPHG